MIREPLSGSRRHTAGEISNDGWGYIHMTGDNWTDARVLQIFNGIANCTQWTRSRGFSVRSYLMLCLATALIILVWFIQLQLVK